MSYFALKHLHVTFVALSFILFFTRGILMMLESRLLNTRLMRIAPHVVDTILLLSAIALAVMWSANGPQAWLVSKVVGLIVYVALGVFALKRGKTKQVRIAFWVAALLVFFWIVSVAITKSPLGIFG